VHAAVEVEGPRARFVINDDDKRLAALGYLPIGDGRSATRWFGREGARHFDRFAASLDAMVRGSDGWERGLLEFFSRVQGTGLRWWLYGSAALAVRGLPVQPGDVDLNVDDPRLAGELLDDLMVTPVERLEGWAAEYVGRAFCGAIVEFLAGPHATLDDPIAPLEQGPAIGRSLERVWWRGYEIRVPPLSTSLRAAERRGLSERAALIRTWIGA
jgi:hypothetical protein